MKKIILFSIIASFFSACTTTLVDYDKNIIITKKTTNNNEICVFTTNKIEQDIAGEYMLFTDSCSKFNVGDTIQLIKK